uniref:Uncharacterized protein n=1 Tax=Rhizophora mucronata TaxID=61149 RepID=A0A2P2PFE4_RHIMU
MFQNLMSVH